MTGIFVPWGSRKDTAGWVEDGSGCHIWVGARSGCGRGMVRLGGKSRYVSRVRYEREVNSIPYGMELDHYVCGRGHDGCVNPWHCRPVSHRENTLRSDGVAARNLAKTHCPRGHPLTGDNLRNIKTGRECLRCHNASTLTSYHRHRSKRLRDFPPYEDE